MTLLEMLADKNSWIVKDNELIGLGRMFTCDEMPWITMKRILNDYRRSHKFSNSLCLAVQPIQPNTEY